MTVKIEPTRFSDRAPSRCRSLLTRAVLAPMLALFFAAPGALHATGIAVPNGDFSSSGNFGQIGGGLLDPSATDAPIGDGPWTGSYHGVLGLLAPPQLTIASGAATIGGLAGINLLNILNNGGYFSQTLNVAYIAGQRYTVSTHVNVGSVLDLGVLGSANVGIALRSGGVTLASTATAPPQLISLSALGGTEYQLALTYDAPETVSGNIDIQLLGTPNSLIGVGLLPSVAYSDVSLDASAINPVAGSVIAVTGTTQQAIVAQPFAEPLGVQVLDADGNGVSGVEVIFTVPSSGASATLSMSSVTTDANGLAGTQATANTVAGSYAISATVAGVDAPASFAFTNLAGAPAALTPVGPGVQQTATVSMPFDDPLVVGVADEYGNPTPGVTVDFSAPDSGASATLSPTNATTDVNGLAQTQGTANAIAGDYVITARVSGLDATAQFALSNALPPGTTIGNGGGDAPQSADLDAPFACALVVHVAQPGGSPYVGAQVTFAAPASGASATLSNGVDSGNSVIATTDASGDASVTATANAIGGDYTVSATLIGGVDTDPVDFALRNIESLIFADGFDRPCSATS